MTQRDKRIEELKKYSKLDLIILLVDTEFSVEVLTQPTRKKAKQVWDKYIKENTKP